MEEKQVLVVLDFITQEVFIYPYDKNIWESPEDFTDRNGNLVIHSNCQYMICDKLNIKMHQ